MEYPKKEAGNPRSTTAFQISRPVLYILSGHLTDQLFSSANYPPKLSNIKFCAGTPRSSSIFSTAFDIGPGPHM